MPVALLALVGLFALARKRRNGGAVPTSRLFARCNLDEQGLSSGIAEGLRRYGGLVERAAAEFGVDPALMLAVIHTESGFSPKAESGVGAIGLMQIMPSTARGIAEQTGIPNTPWDPATNLRMGAWMLSSLLRKWEDPELALASYFAGSGNVQKALDGDYWPESYYNYAHAVISRWEAYGALVRACAA